MASRHVVRGGKIILKKVRPGSKRKSRRRLSKKMQAAKKLKASKKASECCGEIEIGKVPLPVSTGESEENGEVLCLSNFPSSDLEVTKFASVSTCEIKHEHGEFVVTSSGIEKSDKERS